MPKREETAGYIYVLRNAEMPGLIRIGHTTLDVAKRASELSSHESVPVPFEVVSQHFSRWPHSTERLVHRELRRYRVSRSREFFQLPEAIASEVCRRSTVKGGRDQFRRWVRSEVQAPMPTIGQSQRTNMKELAVGVIIIGILALAAAVF